MAGKRVKPLNQAAIKKVVEDSGKVTFPVWFFRQVKAGKLKFWQEKEVSVFFREKGLSDSEEADKYSELLKLY